VREDVAKSSLFAVADLSRPSAKAPVKAQNCGVLNDPWNGYNVIINASA
jgi:hypothetical protein